jgi:hypothetical protein
MHRASPATIATTTTMANNNEDRSALIREFRGAVNRVQNNPRELARLLDVPVPVVAAAQPPAPSSSTTRRQQPQTARDEQFVASDGTDWSVVLSSWLEVIAAAKSVRGGVALLTQLFSGCVLCSSYAHHQVYSISVLSIGRRDPML